ncbi:MAG: hypothetical protein LBQ66_16390 [Planctomycetaceae bacterium]|nr:hypothetical protein [Planctomycetaceae bacterium]
MIYWRRNRPAVGYPTLRLPTRLGVQFQLVRFYYAQRRAGRPRSSPFPLRGNFRSCAAGLFIISSRRGLLLLFGCRLRRRGSCQKASPRHSPNRPD